MCEDGYAIDRTDRRIDAAITKAANGEFGIRQAAVAADQTPAQAFPPGRGVGGHFVQHEVSSSHRGFSRDGPRPNDVELTATTCTPGANSPGE